MTTRTKDKAGEKKEESQTSCWVVATAAEREGEGEGKESDVRRSFDIGVVATE